MKFSQTSAESFTGVLHFKFLVDGKGGKRINHRLGWCFKALAFVVTPQSSRYCSPPAATTTQRRRTDLNRVTMSSPPWSAQETQASTPGVALQQQASESPIGGTPTNSSNPVSASSTSVSPGCGSAAEAGMPTTSPSRAGNGISTAVTGSVTPAAGPSTPTGVPHGYGVPASSFSYGVLPPPNSVSGSSQQSSNNPVLKLTPSVSAAALQPPVPGQSFGNRPSFSYNIVSQANVGLWCQPAIGGKFTAARTAASLQPPVPGQLMRPSSSVPGTSTPNLSPQILMPLSISKWHAPTSTSYSFGGISQPPMPGAPNVFANTNTSDSTLPEAGDSLATSVGSHSTQSSANLASSSAMHPVAGLSMNPSTVLMATASSFPVHSVTTGIAGTPGQLGMLNSMPFSPNGTTVRTNMGSSPSLGSTVPSPIPAPSNPAPHPIQIARNVQQQNYPPYASLPAVTPSPQAPWFHPPLHGGLLHGPVLLGVFRTIPQPNRGMPLLAVPSQTVQPPCVLSAVAHGGTIPFNSSSSDMHSGSALLHPEHERQGSEPSKGGVPKNEEMDAWTGSKFYSKNTTHLGFPTSSLSSMGKLRHPYLVVAVIISLVLLVVGFLTPDTNIIPGRVFMIISSLIMDVVFCVLFGKKAREMNCRNSSTSGCSTSFSCSMSTTACEIITTTFTPNLVVRSYNSTATVLSPALVILACDLI
ncbi:hypothetical protein J5N97_007761 [Dioscorea zingiberensis]|uniref:Uncharacterized protein n=1 Tax=Dioscorea zingiberensis TaxID=325984 RepID=A0A9D5DD10_9LILI|nr:hypothetical protein J5N97_007761 [Dioscorea zingiberensis]